MPTHYTWHIRTVCFIFIECNSSTTDATPVIVFRVFDLITTREIKKKLCFSSVNKRGCNVPFVVIATECTVVIEWCEKDFECIYGRIFLSLSIFKKKTHSVFVLFSFSIPFFLRSWSSSISLFVILFLLLFLFDNFLVCSQSLCSCFPIYNSLCVSRFDRQKNMIIIIIAVVDTMS